MWNKLAEGIIRYRLALSIVIGMITVFMGYHATKVEMSYEFARLVPPDDPDMIYHDKFKAQFGEDANLIAVGMQDSAVFSSKILKHSEN
jgi:predicted RND superfamily exporter protein